jgi:hypothetical protein
LSLGGYLGIFVARLFDGGQNLASATSVIGMGAMFASMMHMPLTGVIIVFELTRADNLILHVVLANFIASNVVVRLPHGSHSFLHRQLTHDVTWLKIGQQDFIETDDQEKAISGALESAFKSLFMPDHERLRLAFEGWVSIFCSGGDVGDCLDPDDKNLLYANSFASPPPPLLQDVISFCRVCGAKQIPEKINPCQSTTSGNTSTYDPTGSLGDSSIESICQQSLIATEESPPMRLSSLGKHRQNSREVVYGVRQSSREIQVNVTIF